MQTGVVRSGVRGLALLGCEVAVGPELALAHRVRTSRDAAGIACCDSGHTLARIRVTVARGVA